jgi:hypothetical protein
VLYNHPNTGDHSVVGPATGINYGYRCGGDKFLVHKEDINLMPQLFMPVGGSIGSVQAPRPQVIAPPPPEPVKVSAPEMKKFNIHSVPGITDEIASELILNGYESEEKFFTLTEEDLKKIDKMSPTRIRIVTSFINAYHENGKNG